MFFCCRLRCKPLRKEPTRCCFWTYASHNEFEDWWILIIFESSSVFILNQKNYGWTTTSDRGLHIIPPKKKTMSPDFRDYFWKEIIYIFQLPTSLIFSKDMREKNFRGVSLSTPSLLIRLEKGEIQFYGIFSPEDTLFFITWNIYIVLNNYRNKTYIHDNYTGTYSILDPRNSQNGT